MISTFSGALCVLWHLWSGPFFVLRLITRLLGADLPVALRWACALSMGHVVWTFLAAAFASLHGHFDHLNGVYASLWLTIAGVLCQNYSVPVMPVSLSSNNTAQKSPAPNKDKASKTYEADGIDSNYGLHASTSRQSYSSDSSTMPGLKGRHDVNDSYRLNLQKQVAYFLMIYVPLVVAYYRLFSPSYDSDQDNRKDLYGAGEKSGDNLSNHGVEMTLFDDLNQLVWRTSDAAWDSVAYHSTLTHAVRYGRVSIWSAIWSWETPLLAGARPSHPMLADIHAGLLMHSTGMNVGSIWVTSAVFLHLPALILSLVQLAHRIAPDAPSSLSLLSPMLFLAAGSDPIDQAASLYWPYVLRDILFPQRSALYAYPIVICVINLGLVAVSQRHKLRRQRIYVIAGLCTGTLTTLIPQAYIGTQVLVIGLICTFYRLNESSGVVVYAKKPTSSMRTLWQDVGFFTGCAGIVGLPFLFSYLPHEPHLETARYPRLGIAIWSDIMEWVAANKARLGTQLDSTEPQSALEYIWHTAGIHILITIGGWKYLDARQRRISIAGWAVYIFTCGMAMQPNPGAHALPQLVWLAVQTSISTYICVQMIFPSSYMQGLSTERDTHSEEKSDGYSAPARHLEKGTQNSPPSPFQKPAIIFVLGLMILPGFIALHSDLQELYITHSDEDLALAAWVRVHTDPAAIFLLPVDVPDSISVFHPVSSLAGRSRLVSPEPWLWPDKPAVARRIRETRSLKSNTEQEKFIRLLDKYHIDYIITPPKGSNQKEAPMIPWSLLETLTDLRYNENGYMVWESRHIVPPPEKKD